MYVILTLVRLICSAANVKRSHLLSLSRFSTSCPQPPTYYPTYANTFCFCLTLGAFEGSKIRRLELTSRCYLKEGKVTLSLKLQRSVAMYQQLYPWWSGRLTMQKFWIYQNKTNTPIKVKRGVIKHFNLEEYRGQKPAQDVQQWNQNLRLEHTKTTLFTSSEFTNFKNTWTDGDKIRFRHKKRESWLQLKCVTIIHNERKKATEEIK